MGVDWLDAEITENAVVFTVDERVYCVEAILRTAYWFTDRAYIFIAKPTDHTLQVHLKTKPATLESPRQAGINELAGEFGNALLNNQLREGIEARTGKIRELLVMKAIAEAGIMEDPPPGTPNDPVAEQRNENLIRIIPAPC